VNCETVLELGPQMNVSLLRALGIIW